MQEGFHPSTDVIDNDDESNSINIVVDDVAKTSMNSSETGKEKAALRRSYDPVSTSLSSSISSFIIDDTSPPSELKRRLIASQMIYKRAIDVLETLKSTTLLQTNEYEVKIVTLEQVLCDTKSELEQLRKPEQQQHLVKDH